MDTSQVDQYKKRPGTSGISGQLYETKLISLILYRLLHNKNVEDFHLASNMDEIGAFDDVCLKVKLEDCEKPLLVLVQAKHKENDDTTLDDKNDLVKWFDSITRVREKFNSNKTQDKIFSGKFEDVDCVFIVYTNAKYDFGKTVSSRPYESNYSTLLNELVSTGAVGSQPIYTDTDVKNFGVTILSEEIPILVEQFNEHLNDSKSTSIMNSEYMVRYHVVLGQKVVNVSDIQETRGLKCRILTFRDEFFKNSDEHFVLFRKHLYEQVLKNRLKIKNNKKLDASILTFLSDPSSNTLSPLIENHITYKNEQLIFITKRPQTDVQRLEKILISPNVIEETKTMAAKGILSSLKLAVPIAFGNIDLAIRGTPEKIEQRLNHLNKVMIELFAKSKQSGTYKIVTIDDSIDDGILSSNGGIGGCVGNILEYDEKTKHFKFKEDYTNMNSNAKSLYLKLKENCNLDEFRIDVQTSKFPKLSLDCSDVARGFLSKLVVYAKQGNHFEVEKILKTEIENYMNASRAVKLNPEVLFTHYHQEIQKWWMLAKSGPYICKENNIYRDSIYSIRVELQRYRIKTSLTNFKWRRFRRALKKGALSSSSDNAALLDDNENTNSEEWKDESVELPDLKQIDNLNLNSN
ncbi:unnamed protein product [Arctia plantaginis]|uniref:Uncharacterized protein n=1 Tax=Arctia plantaginis TaxID=874455 RepID=A0A8S0YSC7_ARCPL|nr:unnamed protein product [Arctia plantaginis]